MGYVYYLLYVCAVAVEMALNTDAAQPLLANFPERKKKVEKNEPVFSWNLHVWSLWEFDFIQHFVMYERNEGIAVTNARIIKMVFGSF